MRRALEVCFGVLLLAVLTVPLIVSSDVFFPFIVGKALVFRTLVLLALFIWALLAVLDEQYRLRLSPLALTLGAFTLIVLIADLLGIHPLKSLWSNFERMEGWFTILHLFLYVLLLEMFFRARPGAVKLYVLTSLAIASFLSMYAVLQILGSSLALFAPVESLSGYYRFFSAYLGSPVIHQGGGRVDATLGNATYYAAYLLFHVFFLLWLILREKMRWRFVLLLPLTLFLLLIVYTGTRGAIAGVALGLSISLALAAFMRTGRLIRTGAVASLGLLVLVGGSFLLLRDTSFVENHPVLSRATDISLDSLGTRFTIWGMAVRGVGDRPLLGWGQENFNIVFNTYYDPSLYAQEPWFDRAHNSFVDWFIAAGALGGLLYLFLWVYALYALWRAPRATASERIALSGLLLAFGFHSLFVFDNLVSYIFFGVMLAWIALLYDRSFSSRLFSGWGVTGRAALAAGASIAAVVLLVSTVLVPYGKAHTLLTALLMLPPNGSYARSFTAFDQALTQQGFVGLQEAREQIAQIATRVVTDPSASPEEKSSFAFRAITEFKEQVTRYPGDARTELLYSYTLRLAGEFDQAEAALLRAHELSPRKQQIYQELGLLSLERGNREAALSYFQTAFTLDTRNTKAVPPVAAGLVLNGRGDEASALLFEHFGTDLVYDPLLVFAYQTTGQIARAQELSARAP